MAYSDDFAFGQITNFHIQVECCWNYGRPETHQDTLLFVVCSALTTPKLCGARIVETFI